MGWRARIRIPLCGFAEWSSNSCKLPICESQNPHPVAQTATRVGSRMQKVGFLRANCRVAGETMSPYFTPRGHDPTRRAAPLLGRRKPFAVMGCNWPVLRPRTVQERRNHTSTGPWG